MVVIVIMRLSGWGLESSVSHARLSALGSRLSALGSRLSALGSRLSALGSRLPAPGSRLPAPSPNLYTPKSAHNAQTADRVQSARILNQLMLLFLRQYDHGFFGSSGRVCSEFRASVLPQTPVGLMTLLLYWDPVGVVVRSLLGVSEHLNRMGHACVRSSLVARHGHAGYKTSKTASRRFLLCWPV